MLPDVLQPTSRNPRACNGLLATEEDLLFHTSVVAGGFIGSGATGIA